MIKTKEELLNHFSDINERYNNSFMYQTLSNLIDELLEQQPCEDAISRQMAIDAIAKIHPIDTEYDCTLYDKLDVMYVLKDLPPVTPKTQPSEDCISRAEALDAIEKEKQGWEGTERYAIDECHTRIADLPSVKPKAKPCEDCISRAEVLKYAQFITDDEGITHEVVHVDDIKCVTPMTWSGWTLVTDELPEPNTAVLLYVKYKSSRQRTYQLGMWNDSKQVWEDWRTPYPLEEEFDVIAWMELPERYEEVKYER